MTRPSWTSSAPALRSVAFAALFALASCDGRSVVGSGNDATVADIGDVTVDAAPVCTATQTLCAGRCVDLMGDPANCGVCGTACQAGLVCAAGACQVRCLEGQVLCAGR